MKILLVGINAKYAHTNPAIRYLKNYAGLREVEIAEYTINMPLEQVYEDLAGRKADAYGFSTYIWNVEYCRRLAARLRREGAIFLAGGPEATHSPAEILDWADYVLTGEGEAAFKEWAEAFLRGRDPRHVPSLCYREGGQVHRNPPARQVALCELAQPYFDLPRLRGRVLYYESSRGCPFHCTYCLSSVEEGVRFSPVEKVKRDLDEFICAGVLKVKFVDRTFNADKRRAKEILAYIAERGGDTAFHFEIAGDLLDQEMVDILSRMKEGQVQLEIGVQSTHPPTLEAIRRKQDFAHTGRMVRKLVRQGNVQLHLDLIAGLPLESMDSFARSLDDVMDIGVQTVQLGFLKVLKGSRMERDARYYGISYSDTAPYEVISTATMSEADLKRLKEMAYLLERVYNSALFRHTTRWFAKEMGGYFAFFSALADHCERHGIQPEKLTEAGLTRQLLDFGTEQRLGYARDFLRLDCLLRPFRPKLPVWLEDGREAERRALYEDLPGEWRAGLPRGKRPWHYSRIQWFDFDVNAYLARGRFHPGERVFFFNYVDGSIKSCPNHLGSGQPL